MKDYGVELAVKMIKHLTAEAQVPGVHLCTLNLEKSVQRVIGKLGWSLSNDAKFTNKLIAVSVPTSLHFGFHRRVLCRTCPLQVRRLRIDSQT